MRAMRRLATALGATAVIFALVGCGGLGVNIGSGTSRGSQVVNLVSVQPQSGVNIPNVEVNHVLLMQAIAYYQFGSQNYVSATQGATWTTCTTTACTAPWHGIILLDAATNCTTPYAPGTVNQTVCVFGVGGEAGNTGFLKATVAGVSGLSALITVTF